MTDYIVTMNSLSNLSSPMYITMGGETAGVCVCGCRCLQEHAKLVLNTFYHNLFYFTDFSAEQKGLGQTSLLAFDRKSGPYLEPAFLHTASIPSETK